MSYWQTFRLILTITFLYLIQSLFYVWDGFMFYGTLSDFMQGVTFVIVTWSIALVVLTIFIWLSFKVISQCCLRKGWKFRIEHFLLFIIIFILLVLLGWNVRAQLWRYIEHTRLAKLIILITVACISILFATLTRNRAASWISIIQKHITPLVWLFMILILLSIPVIAYQIVYGNLSIGKKSAISLGTIQPLLENKVRPNIILVTFDALTARDMSLYGYHRETTPFITKWAQDATVFTRAEAESNYTTPTTASMMTGKRVWTHQLYQPHGYNAKNADTESLPLLLQKAGYYNIALIQNNFASVKTLGISNSFDIAPLSNEFKEPASVESFIERQLYLLFGHRYHLYNWIFRRNIIVGKLLEILPQKIFVTEYPPPKIFDKLLEIIEKNPPEPLFAWVHLFPPHAPYLPPEPYMSTYDSSSQYRTLRSQRRLLVGGNYDIKRARYDEFILYCDKAFELFSKKLSTYNKKFVIVMSSDHGQSFEHDFITHGGPHLYEQLTNIPLIIKEPDRTGGRIIDNIVEQVDIAPTILELASVQVPKWMEGRSLVPLLRGEELEPKFALSMMLEGTPNGNTIKRGTIAIWKDDYKVVHYLEDNKSLLFSLKKDPDELNNLFNSELEIGQHFITLIQNELEKANEKIRNGQ